mgnify:CR=1 FL=1
MIELCVFMMTFIALELLEIYHDGIMSLTETRIFVLTVQPMNPGCVMVILLLLNPSKAMRKYYFKNKK